MRIPRVADVALCALLLSALIFTGCESGGGTATSRASEESLQGVWNTAYTTPMGRMTSQLILKDDGTYQKMDRNVDSGYTVLLSGKYQVTAGALRLNIEHAEPTQNCGPLGCDTIAYPAAENYTYSTPASGTLQLEAAGLGTWVFKRAM